MNETGTRTVRFQRANFLVSDIDKALVLYRDILGLTLDLIKDSPDNSYSYPVFEIDPARKLRFAVLSAPDQPRVMALTEVQGGLPEIALPRRATIVLEIQEIDAVLEDCRKHGFHVYPEETLETHDGRTGREIGIVDHDGNLVVIYRILAHPQADNG